MWLVVVVVLKVTFKTNQVNFNLKLNRNLIAFLLPLFTHFTSLILAVVLSKLPAIIPNLKGVQLSVLLLGDLTPLKTDT